MNIDDLRKMQDSGESLALDDLKITNRLFTGRNNTYKEVHVNDNTDLVEKYVDRTIIEETMLPILDKVKQASIEEIDSFSREELSEITDNYYKLPLSREQLRVLELWHSTMSIAEISRACRIDHNVIASWEMHDENFQIAIQLKNRELALRCRNIFYKQLAPMSLKLCELALRGHYPALICILEECGVLTKKGKTVNNFIEDNHKEENLILEVDLSTHNKIEK